jgi:hypothetical protein
VLLDDIIAGRYGEVRPELRVVGDLGDGYYAIALRPADEDLAQALDAPSGGSSSPGRAQQHPPAARTSGTTVSSASRRGARSRRPASSGGPHRGGA